MIIWVAKPKNHFLALLPTQFYTYKDNRKRENDIFSTQSFPVTLSGNLISWGSPQTADFTRGFPYF